MTDSGGLLIENKSGKMVLNAEQVIALRAFIDATREGTAMSLTDTAIRNSKPKDKPLRLS